MDVESRKRHIEDAEPLPTKKRALADANGTPVLVNSTLPLSTTIPPEEEPKDQDALEQFRKEAVFRRMRHYSREYDRSQARITELERLKGSYEASLAVMGACWTQLVDTIRALVKPDSAPLDVETEDLFCLSKHVSSEEAPALANALEEKAQSTHRLIATFVQLGGVTVFQDEMFRRHQRSQTECTALRAELAVTRTKLQDLEAQRDQYHAELTAAEIRFDRQQSRTVQSIHGRSTPPSTDESRKEEEEEAKLEGGNAQVKVEEPQPSSPAPAAPQTNGMLSSEELDQLRDISVQRESKIKTLEQEISTLRIALRDVSVNRELPSHDTIQASPAYQLLVARVSKLEHMLKESKTQQAELQEVKSKLESSRQEHEQALTAAHEQTLEDLRAQLSKRDAENARVRDQRDRLVAELHERKQKDSVKRQSFEELKLLAESRSQRIGTYKSEVSTLKRLVAAKSGDADLVAYLANEKSGEVSYVDDLKNRLVASEERVNALEEQLARFEADHPDVVRHMRSAANAQQELAAAKNLLRQYQSTYGESSHLPPDMHHLAEQLREKEAESEALRLQQAQHMSVTDALEHEIMNLSTHWESVEKQIESKVFDLAAAEERIMKSNLEKAKADNKYFATMREKEALENENKHLIRTMEKQEKVIEKLGETEKLQSQRMTELEKLVLQAGKKVDLHQARVDAVELDVNNARAEIAKRSAELTRLNKINGFNVEESHRHRLILNKLEEERAELKGIIERQAMVVKTRPGTTSQKEATLQKEVDKCMSILKCSTCRINMRSTVLSKCLHTFCKQCIEARVSTRQRKCPACNLAFAQSEVQQIFFQ